MDEGQARATCRALATTEGLFVGTSSGLNVAGAMALASEMPVDSVVATVCCDTGIKYLSTDLFAR